jgi:hypothetical protein
MPGPFPGVDPYLESQGYWPDFHTTFLTYCREAIADRLPDHYEARIDERVNLASVPDEPVRQFRPDVAVERLGGGPGPAGEAAAVAVLTEDETVPVELVMLDDERERFIEVLHRPERSLVAVIELLSPSNKAEPGRGVYLARRNAVLWQPIHLIELDFLLGGARPPMRGALPSGHYYTFVSRAERRPVCDVHAWTVRRPLPTIKVPLRPPDPDVPLDLAAVFSTAYDRGRYVRSINYAAPLGGAGLSPEDRAWAEARAREARR